MDNALLITVLNEVIISLQENDYVSPSGGISLLKKNVNKRRIRRLKKRLRKLSGEDYERYRKLRDLLEYHLLFQIILE